VAQPLIAIRQAPTVPAGRPRTSVIPEQVAKLAGKAPVRPVWENELGGLTFAVGEGVGRSFVKWAPVTSGIDLDAEAARLRWARRFTPVPGVLGQGADDAGGWMATSPIVGDSAVATRWKRDPATAVQAIGTGLRALHDALPVDACPFSWSTADRVAGARAAAAAGPVDPARWHPVVRSMTVQQALGTLADPPSIDKAVVCHGDACAPNTILADDGRWSGHVDLGALGVGDRWADLAVCTWSTQWNYGPGWEHMLLSSYGIESDPVRTRYYRLLWALGP